MKPLHTTWVILREHDRVLLGLKKRGFGKGNINGVGGKVDPGETPEQAAVRETEEEIGIRLSKFESVATIIFDDLLYKQVRQQNIMHCYIATKWEGELIETDEIKPQWFEIDKIPYDKMWIDDQFWLPQVLSGKPVEARFKFNDDYEIVSQTVNVLPGYTLAIIRDSDFGLPDGNPETYETRYAARAILLNEKNEVALINAAIQHYFKLPGGGVDEGELVYEALRREVLEEAGWEIDILDQVGQIVEYRAQFKLLQYSYACICRATQLLDTCLMEDEIADGFELQWFPSIDAAIAAVDKVDISKLPYQGKYFTTRERIFLEAASKILH